MTYNPDRLVLTPPRLARILMITLSAVFVMHSLTLMVAHGLGYPVALGFVPLFHVDFEHNVPTFLAFVLWISSALASAWMAAREPARPRHRRAWLLLSLLFLAVAADEVLHIHEQVGEHLFGEFGHLGVPMYAWVIPYSAGVLLVGAFFLRWFLELEPSLRRLLFLAGTIFLFGAIGLELVASYHYELLPADREVYRTLTGDLLSTVEEACEFVGVSLYLYALVRHLGGISIRALDPAATGSEPAAA